MTIAIVIVIFCAAWTLFVLAGYPMWLAVRARLFGRPPRSGPNEPTVTAVIPVYNGVQFLSAKLDSILASDYPTEKLDILVLSDASSDGTDQVVERYARRFPDRIRARHLPRGGKAAALNAALPEVNAEVLLLTDVRQQLHPDCVRRLAEMLHDPQVGVVSGNLKIHSGESLEEVHVGLYWRYESWIRSNLGRIDSLMGATGPIYAMRRKLAQPLPAGCILDDVWLPMQAVLAGYRSVLDEQAIAWDYPTSLDSEFARKVRTQAGLFQLTWQLPGLFSLRNRLHWPFLFCKLGRLLLPEILIVCLIASLCMPPAVRWPALALQGAFYGLALLDRWISDTSALKLATAPVRAFVVLLAAALFAVSIFFVAPERLWKHTKVRKPRAGESPLEPNASR
jgi:cellulose synthase/poly-beta-1,6-N-acetylglucosamine synthase-like glycosyltransferase